MDHRQHYFLILTDSKNLKAERTLKVISNFSEHESYGLFIQLKFQGPHSLENGLLGEGFPRSNWHNPMLQLYGEGPWSLCLTLVTTLWYTLVLLDSNHVMKSAVSYSSKSQILYDISRVGKLLKEYLPSMNSSALTVRKAFSHLAFPFIVI